jgi:hypothetical protein
MGIVFEVFGNASAGSPFRFSVGRRPVEILTGGPKLATTRVGALVEPVLSLNRVGFCSAWSLKRTRRSAMVNRPLR